MLVSNATNPLGEPDLSTTGLDATGLSYDKTDSGSGVAGWLDLRTLDLTAYDVVLIGSGTGGSGPGEAALLNARAGDLRAYVAGGGGVIAGPLEGFNYSEPSRPAGGSRLCLKAMMPEAGAMSTLRPLEAAGATSSPRYARLVCSRVPALRRRVRLLRKLPARTRLLRREVLREPARP